MSIKRRTLVGRFLLAAILALALAALPGCGSSKSSSSAGGGQSSGGSQTIKIGYVSALSGWLAEFEDSFVKGLQLKVAEVNKAGGLAGKYHIQLTILDGKSDPAQGAIAAQQLVSQNVSVMFGPCDQDVGLPAAQIAAKHHIPFISSCAGASQFTDLVKPYVYLSVPGTWADGSAMAQFALAHGWKTAYLLYSKDIAYLQSVGEAFQAQYKKHGGKVLGPSIYKMGQPNYTADIDQIANANPRPSVIAGVAITPDSIVMLRELASRGINIPVLLPYGNETNLILGPKQALKQLQVYVLGLSPIPKAGTPLGTLFTQFKSKYGAEPAPTQLAMAADDMAVLDSAVKSAGSTDSQAIQTALQQIDNVQGITGPVTYKGEDGRPKKNYIVVRVEPTGFKSALTFFPSDVYHP